MDKNLRKICGLLCMVAVLGAIVFICGGMDSAINFFAAMGTGIKFVLSCFWDVFIEFLPYWDLENWAICVAIFFGVLHIASLGGTYYSAKQKNKLWKNICTAFDVISLVLTLAFASY